VGVGTVKQCRDQNRLTVIWSVCDMRGRGRRDHGLIECTQQVVWVTSSPSSCGAVLSAYELELQVQLVRLQKPQA
jgi:hypothetical protein